MTFAMPLYVGELLRCTASVNAAWRTSMEVGVRVEAENAVTREVRHTSTAYLTMVAVRRNRLTEREEILKARQAAGEETG